MQQGLSAHGGRLARQRDAELREQPSRAVDSGGAARGIPVTLAALPSDASSISLVDWGCGIPKHVLADITRRFFTTEPVGSGSGLGLASAERIIRMHGGRTMERSLVDVGTEITLHLPPVAECHLAAAA